MVAIAPIDSVRLADISVQAATSESWLWPTSSPQGIKITSSFGYRNTSNDTHNAIDIRCKMGTPVLATKSGTVFKCVKTYGSDEKTSAGGTASWGNYIILKHKDGTYSLYAHLSKGAPVSTGDAVTQGLIIAYSGDSGNSSGPHLHFSARSKYVSSWSKDVNEIVNVMPTEDFINKYNMSYTRYKLPNGWPSTRMSYNCKQTTPTPTPTPQTSTTNPDSYPFPSKSVNNANYKAGTVTANEIKWVQAVLYQFGFLTSSGIDGKFGPNSVAATKNFQSAYGLTADGSAGPNTLNKMKNLWNEKKGTHTHTVVSATCTKPMHCSTCGTTAGNALGHIYSNSCDTSCNRCGTTRQASHNYKTTITKATLSANGRWVDKCTVCGHVYNDLNISRPVTFELSTITFTYNGKVRTPSVIVKDADGYTISPSNYMVLYSSGRKNVGTYKVFIMMKGKYTGTKTLTFKINPAKISSYQLFATSYTYNGKVKTPSVTVKNVSGGKLTNGTSYTVTYSTGRKNVGTYKVTIKGKGNYTGTKTLTFKINPPKTTVSKLTAGKKSITVAITKKSTQVTGYQIQYSTSKTFSKAITKTISSYKTTKYALKSLNAKKTYYVRVRTYKTVGKTKYYSGWSTYKYVKTK